MNSILIKDCIQLFSSLKLALEVLKTMCRVAGLNGGMQKAIEMDSWIDDMVNRLTFDKFHYEDKPLVCPQCACNDIMKSTIFNRCMCYKCKHEFTV